MSRRTATLLALAALLAGAALLLPARDPSRISLLDFASLEAILADRVAPDPDPFARPYPRRYRLAVLSYLTPQELHRKGALLSAYLERNLGVSITPIYSANYDSLGDLMLERRAEIVWASPFHYMKLKSRLDYTLVAKISAHGRGDYGGVIIVRRDAPYRSIEELAGHRIAFVDPSSSSGFQLPNHWLGRRGIDPFAWFSDVRFSGKHDLVVDDVVKGRADCGAVYDSIMDFRTDLIRTEEIRVLADVGTVPQAPILVSNVLPPAERERVRTFLLDAARHPLGAEMLKGLAESEGFTGFIPATPEEYAY